MWIWQKEFKPRSRTNLFIQQKVAFTPSFVHQRTWKTLNRSNKLQNRKRAKEKRDVPPLFRCCSWTRRRIRKVISLSKEKANTLKLQTAYMIIYEINRLFLFWRRDGFPIPSMLRFYESFSGGSGALWVWPTPIGVGSCASVFLLRSSLSFLSLLLNVLTLSLLIFQFYLITYYFPT